MVCNQNKNSTGLIDGSQGFTRCAQIRLATKIGGATAIQKIGSNEPWDLGLLWEPLLYWYISAGAGNIFIKTNPVVILLNVPVQNTRI